MKKLFILATLFIASFAHKTVCAANGDSIFNMTYIHELRITFPYTAFYDSLLWSHANDTYLIADVVFNGHSYPQVGIKGKGNSSFNGPSQKKSFKLDLNRFVAGQDLHGLKKLNFNNSFKDPSFMREKLCNDFLREHDLPAPRTTYCNVYMNNVLWGLYVIVEEVDDEFCKRWFGNNDENLFKGDPHGDLRWKGSATQSLYETEYELENNSTANNWSDLISLIDVINNTSSGSLYPALDTKLNTSRFVKHWAAMNLFSSMDSYLGSGHNYYIYHDSLSQQFEWIAWDNNEAFGSFKQSLTSAQLKNMDMYYVSQPATNRPLVNNMLANSTYKKLYNDAYCALKADFTNAYFDARIDSFRQVIQSSVYADTKKMYSNSMFDSSMNYDLNLSGPGGIVVFGLKPFINDRQIAATASLMTHGVNCQPLSIPSSEAASIEVSPNPFLDQMHIKCSLGLNSILVTDIYGRAVYEHPTCSGQTAVNISTSTWSMGVYLVCINHARTLKVIKE